MVFSSLEFLFGFMPVFLFAYLACPVRWKNLCLLAGSLCFYLYGVKDHPFYFLLFIASILFNFRLGALIGRRRFGTARCNWMIFGIVCNLLCLALFKYAGFAAENINALLVVAGVQAVLPVYRPVLPLGISFYTFQAISYLVDVSRRTVRYERRPLNFLLYLAMFPQRISGPIVTYGELQPQIQNRAWDLGKLEDGLREFTIGLGLKVLLANRLSGLWNQVGSIGYESISTPLAWMGIAAFSLQIYFDFCGYSLMAQGLGRMLGFELPDNFRHPYTALSMTDFWRRWHITLGLWFRRYVYIPLGGNRRGKTRMFLNLLVVWLLTGFWHGANWNFLLWGLLLFALISVEKLGLIRLLEGVRPLGHLYMLFAIPLSWLVFAEQDIGKIGSYLGRLFPFLSGAESAAQYAGDYLKYGRLYGLYLVLGLVFMTGLPRRIYDRYRRSPLTAVLLLAVFWLSVYSIRKGLNDPFMYFRF